METDNAKRIKTATGKLLRALRAIGAKVEVIKTDFWPHSPTGSFVVNGVETYICFDTVGRYAAPPAILKLTFGHRPTYGKRLVLREPKRGFDFKTLAHRVIAWVAEERVRLNEEAHRDKILETNRALANKLRKEFKKNEAVRFYSHNHVKSPVVDVDIHLDNVTEAVARRVTKAVVKAIGVKKMAP